MHKSSSAGTGSTSLQQLFEMSHQAFQEKNYDLAINIYNNIIKQHPGNADALHYQGLCYYQSGEIELAHEKIQASLSIAPDDSIYNSNYGLILFEQKQYSEAEIYLTKAVRLNPGNIDAQLNLSLLFMRTQRNQLAKKILEPLALNYTRDFSLQVAYAQCLRDCGELQSAITQFKNVFKIQPDSVCEEIECCGVLMRAGMVVESEQAYKDLVTKYPDNIDVLLNMVIAYEKNNKLDLAEHWLKKASEINNVPMSQIYLEYAKIKRRQNKLDEAVSCLERININELREMEVIYYHFECGDVLNNAGKYDEAFAAYKNGNDARIENYQISFERDAFANTLKKNQTEYFSKNYTLLLDQAKNSVRSKNEPIFIVGFPRSGSTLIEKILASHPTISDGGEFNSLLEVQQECAELIGPSKTYSDCLHALATHPDALNIVVKLRQIYMNKVAATGLIDESKKWFTDKRLLTSLDLGFVRLLFPNSPIIHVVRHPLDVCLSTFFTDFDVGHEYALTLPDTGYMFSKVIEQVDLSLKNMELNYIRVKYESVIQNPKVEVARLLSFIGEEWDDNCLEFYNNKRVARTASYAQVNQKLYSTSMNRYLNYRKFIPELIEALGPTIETLGYSVE